MEKKIIKEATEMTGDIPASDVLVPLQLEEDELVPYPKSEYDVVCELTLDKFNRKVNQMIGQGRMPTGWVNVVQTPNWTRFYQSMERWNIDYDEKPEMPSEISEAGTMGPNAPLWEGMKFLENEEDLYEDIDKDATDWEANW